MKYTLSPSLLTWLRCFDAAARNNSFTKAAAELHVTQGSVSQQVKHLEDHLGVALFHRTRRSLVLSQDGFRLAMAVNQSFQLLDDALGQIRRSGRNHALSLSCSPSFAMVWLTPRLGQLFRENPDLSIRVHGEFQTLDRFRMEEEHIQAGIRFDPGNYSDLYAEQFLDEWLIPVASPAFLAAHPDIKQPADLPSAFMLHDAVPWDNAPEDTEWNTWLEGVGSPIPTTHDGQHFNLSQLAVTAALTGQGVAMGRMALVLDDLVKGRLVAPFAIPVRSKASYYFISTRQRSENVGAIETWLQRESKRFQRARDAWFKTLPCKP
ncbi:LysR family transcriptional regulator [Candidimonas sp. SYP-B2681]|uniref:LysR family transcriptional regulator n=1 Tax=Candidimonas sp. SYP-B2681 TaxID=2497686 RepID=UPI000F86029B|nr:LysR family transcriptional regulator [Candidimonas sp. SYP-B2681]RTZ43219.1 LysR family transcriptional regulator [Candidimonas sp. SYP-B2681]